MSDHHPADLQVHIVQGLAGNKIIIIYFAFIYAVTFVQISFTDTYQMRMMVRDNIFNSNCFIFQVSTSSIPVTQLDASVSSVSISVPGIEVAIRQYGMLEWKSSNYPASVQVASLNPLQGSRRVNSCSALARTIPRLG